MLAILLVACSQGGSGHKLQDSTAPGAKYTLVHAGAPW